MPIHDWKRAAVRHFHHFHLKWTSELCDGLNGGVLPKGFYAMVEQRAIGREPDVLALALGPEDGQPPNPRGGGLAVETAPPQTRFVARETEAESLARKANRVGVRSDDGDLVAMIEILSPGNKHSRMAIREFVGKTAAFLRAGVNVLVIDLFPPTPRDPAGIHKAVWDEFQDDPFELPADKPLVLVSYSAAYPRTAYVEPVAVGDAMPPMPVFLDAGTYVPAPLEDSYQRTWDKCPPQVQGFVLNPRP